MCSSQFVSILITYYSTSVFCPLKKCRFFFLRKQRKRRSVYRTTSHRSFPTYFKFIIFNFTRFDFYAHHDEGRVNQIFSFDGKSQTLTPTIQLVHSAHGYSLNHSTLRNVKKTPNSRTKRNRFQSLIGGQENLRESRIHIYVLNIIR